jgi:hypothetical protein
VQYYYETKIETQWSIFGPVLQLAALNSWRCCCKFDVDFQYKCFYTLLYCTIASHRKVKVKPVFDRPEVVELNWTGFECRTSIP